MLATMANNTRLQTVWKLSKSLIDCNWESTLPAFTHTKLYGMSPKNAVIAKIWSGMLSIGDVILINQFGVTGTSLSESKKKGNLFALLWTLNKEKYN